MGKLDARRAYGPGASSSRAGRRIGISSSPRRTANRVSAPPQPGAMPTVSAPSRSRIRLSAFMMPSRWRRGRSSDLAARPHRRHRAFEALERELNVIGGMRRGDRTLLGGDRNEKDTQVDQRPAQQQIALEVMMFHDVMEIDRICIHQIVRKSRTLAGDGCRDPMPGEY